MKKSFLSLAVLLSAAMFAAPVLEAKGNRGGRGSSVEQSRTGQRPGRGGSSDVRPGGGNSAPSRPGVGNSEPSRPGGAGNGSNFNPGHNHNDNGSYRPAPPAAAPSRPSAPAAPSRPVAPPPPAPGVPTRPGTVRPGYNRPSVMAPPTRPGRPVYGTWTRPQPPASWRPAHRYNVVPNILGMTFGLTINSALDHLYNTGYSIDGYGTQEIYLRNVSELGYYWDDATLYFSGSGLVRSQFYDSSSYYDLSRYNSIYNSLSASYGAPVNQTYSGGQFQATWFGYSNEYVTLQYALMNSSSGYRYFTILTYGN